MRRSERAVTTFSDKLAILQACKVFRLGIWDGFRPYVVPLNFGYQVQGERLTLYFHSAPEGKKCTLLARFPEVGFEMDCHTALKQADTACTHSYFYESVLGAGRVRLLKGSEKVAGMQAIMLHQTGKTFVLDIDILDRTAVYALDVTEFCGKNHK